MLSAAGVATAGTPWRTEKQAETYLEKRLLRWAGIDLRYSDFKFAFCFGSPLFGGRINAVGEDIYQRFNCTFSAEGRTFHLKLWTLVRGWRVAAGQFP